MSGIHVPDPRDECPDCGHDGYDSHDMRETGRRQTCAECGPADPCSPETLSTVTAAQIVAAIEPHYPGARIVVEHTGGGCATVFVNPRQPANDGDDFGYDLAAGPGAYDWTNPSASRFWLDDLNVGRADEGYPVESLDDLTAYLNGAPTR